MSCCGSVQCAYRDEKSGKCTFAGNCLVNSYNLKDAVLSCAFSAPIQVQNAAAAAIEFDGVFNPFNISVLGGYMREKKLAHVR